MYTDGCIYRNLVCKIDVPYRVAGSIFVARDSCAQVVTVAPIALLIPGEIILFLPCSSTVASVLKNETGPRRDCHWSKYPEASLRLLTGRKKNYVIVIGAWKKFILLLFSSLTSSSPKAYLLLLAVQRKIPSKFTRPINNTEAVSLSRHLVV